MTTEGQLDAVPAGPTVTDAVTTAFALGWQMARLYTSSVDSDSDPVVDTAVVVPPSIGSETYTPGAEVTSTGPT